MRRYKGAADDGDGDGGGLVVGDVEDGASGVVVDEFDAEDFALREGGEDVDGESRGLEFGFVGYFVANLLDFFYLGDMSVIAVEDLPATQAYFKAFRELDLSG